jgi:hypothetical protein
MTSSNLTAQDFQVALENFIGSQNLYYRETSTGRIEYTDGIYFLQRNGCLWLIDAIVSYQTQEFKAIDDRQFWKLRVDTETHTANLICDDGNGNIRATQLIEFTDFPLSELNIYVEITHRIFLCLMSEY